MIELTYQQKEFRLLISKEVEIKQSNWRFKKEVVKISREIIEDENIRIYILNLSNYHDVESFISKLQIVVEKSMKEYQINIHQTVNDYINTRKLYLSERQKIGKGIIDEIPEIINTPEFDAFNKVLDNELERNLRSKQRIASFHTAKMKRTMNFSVPGSGKTSMVYGAYAYLSSPCISKVEKILIIAPINASRAWREEFVMNFGNKRELSFFDLSNLDRKSAYLNIKPAEVNFINYEKVSALEEFLYEFIDNNTLLVLDEVHRIKNPKGVRATSVKNATEKAGYIATLTGTPLPNKYVDLYNMMNILFRDDYNFFGYSENELINPTEFLMNEIKGQIEPFFFRVTKEQLGVPVKNDDLYYYASQTDYEKELFDIIKEKDISYLAKYIYLQQTEMNPSQASFLKPDSILSTYYPEESMALNNKLNDYELDKFKRAPTSAKLKLTLNLIIKLVTQNKPVLVWCNFRATMSEIKKQLDIQGIKSEEISGSVGKNERDTIIDNFKSNVTKVLISNPQTLAESVSLHEVCHDAIFCELNLNLAHFVQSKDRVHRLGLPDEQYTQYHYIFAEYNGKSLDKNTLELLERKEAVMNEFLAKGDFSIDYYETTEEEIKELIGGSLVD